jgi:sugar phosphate isomerase/epimerase
MATSYTSYTSYTSNEISERLAISTAVFQNEILGESHFAKLNNVGINRIEISSIPRSFDYHNPSQVAEIKQACKTHNVQVVSVHGPFNLSYNNADESVRKQVVEDSLKAIRFAAGIGASIYIAHFGFKEHGAKTITELLTPPTTSTSSSPPKTRPRNHSPLTCKLSTPSTQTASA